MNEYDEQILSEMRAKAQLFVKLLGDFYGELAEATSDFLNSAFVGGVSRSHGALDEIEKLKGSHQVEAEPIESIIVLLRGRAHETIKTLLLTKDYVRDYVLHGVPHQELDVHPSSAKSSFRLLMEERGSLRESLKALDPKSAQQAGEFFKRYIERKKAAFKAEAQWIGDDFKPLIEKLERDIEGQETYAMSPEGRQELESIQKRLKIVVANFRSYARS